MEYTVKNLLEEKVFPEMRLVCEKGLERNISGIRIVEIRDMAKYLIGGEILLTSLYVYEGCSINEFRTYLTSLLEKNVSGFIVKKREEIDDQRKKIEILKKFCIQKEIPLLEISSNMYYWGIIQYVMSKVYTDEVARLKYFKLTHDNFNAISFDNLISDNKIGDTLELLDNMLNNPVRLYYGNGHCYISTDGNETNLVLSDNLREYEPDIVTAFRFLRQEMEYVQYIVKIKVVNQINAYVVITEKNKKLSLLDYMAIENAIITIQYQFIGLFAKNELERKYHRDIMHNILNGTLNKAEIQQGADFLGIRKDSYYRVIVFHILHENIENKYTKEQLEEVGIIEGEITELFPKEILYRNANQVVMIQKVNPREGKEKYRKSIEDAWETIQTSTALNEKKLNIKAGIGRMIQGVENLALSYKEANKAISYIDIVRSLSDNPNKSVVFYSDLGFFKVLGDIERPEELLDYIPETLKRLYNYEKTDRKDLLHTLQTYLECNQSVTKTAQRLFVHNKTVNYRINKIKKITGMDYKQSNDMLNVRIGLIICKMLRK